MGGGPSRVNKSSVYAWLLFTRLHAQRRVIDWPVSTVRHRVDFCFRPIVKLSCMCGTIPRRTWCSSLAWLIVCVMIILVKVYGYPEIRNDS